MTEQREPGSQHPTQPRTAAGRRMLRVLADAHPEPRENREWERKQVLAIEAEAAASAPTPAAPPHDCIAVEAEIVRLTAELDMWKAAAPTPAVEADYQRFLHPTPAEPLDVERLAEAMHPHGEPTVFLCCMGSSLTHIEDEVAREAEHRRYHRESAEAVARNYDRLAAARPDTPASAEQPGLREALERIAAMDYRGNEPEEQRIARAALAASPSPEPEGK